jgi:hypothetical protein
MTAPDPTSLRGAGMMERESIGAMIELRQGSVPATRATYRALLLRGFTQAEAANLTAYLSGLQVGGSRPWRLADVDRLLFLRELCRTGRLGSDDGLEPIGAIAPA